MPKRIAPLSDTQLRNVKAKDKEYKLSDGGGLYLLVTPSGGKLWNMKYRYNGKEKRLSFGAYPARSLADARQRRENAKKLLANDIDPGEMKKSIKQARIALEENSFELIAREWHTKYLTQWSSDHAATIMSRLERDVFPWLGTKPISEIKPVDILPVLRRVEDRGALETAHRIKTVIGQVLRYAVATGRAERDSTADLKGALPPTISNNMAALTDPKDVAELLKASDAYKGSFVVRCALKLAPLFFCRPGELRHTEWAEIDFEKAQLNIPIERLKLLTKAKRENKGKLHLIPLSKQAIAILKELQPLTGHSKYVFPGHRSPLRPMSENAVIAAMRRMGFEKEEMSGHGYRAMARTMIRQELHLEAEYIEIQLAHKTKNANGTAYDRVSFLPERRKMMQLWADYLDGLKQGAKVIPFRREAA
jgi:integrase